MSPSLTLAVTAWETARTLPAGRWCGIGLAVGALILAVGLARVLARANRLVLALACFVAAITLFFAWLQERNEPHLLSPLFDRVAQFFPATGPASRR